MISFPVEWTRGQTVAWTSVLLGRSVSIFLSWDALNQEVQLENMPHEMAQVLGVLPWKAQVAPLHEVQAPIGRIFPQKT